MSNGGRQDIINEHTLYIELLNCS